MTQSKEADQKVDIVAIHGVGDRKPGAVLDSVLLGLSDNEEIQSKISSKYYNRHGYRYAEVNGHPQVASVLEVNWDDISHPAHSPIQYLTHFISVISSTLRHAVKPIDNQGEPSRAVQAYRWAFNACLIWCIYLPIATIAGVAPTKLGQIFWIAGTAVFVGLLTVLFSKYDKGFHAGWVWVAGVIVIGLASIIGDESRDLALSVATWIYGLVQGLTGVALLIAMGVAWHRSRKARIEQRLARLAFLYLPFAIFSGIGALLWATTLFIANYALPEQGFEVWREMYQDRLIYDLAFAEALLATGVALGGVLLCLPAALLIRDDQGARVHAWLLTALKIFPLIVVGVFGLYMAHLFMFGNLLAEGDNYPAYQAWVQPLLLLFGITLPDTPNMFKIYMASSLRLLPYLLYFVGPFRYVLDTVGDVLLYTDPNGHLGSTNVRKGSQSRLSDALDHLLDDGIKRPLVVLAHSQGTAIAADVLAQKNCDQTLFVSMGSPISSLYWRFIGTHAVTPPQCAWLNLFRTGDYIAGGKGISASWAPASNVKDQPLDTGYHSHYFKDPLVWRYIKPAITKLQKP